MAQLLKYLKKINRHSIIFFLFVFCIKTSIFATTVNDGIVTRLIVEPKNTNYPVLAGDIITVDTNLFIADNASGMIFKYDLPALNYSGKFSAMPDLLTENNISTMDLNKYRFYFGAKQPFDIKLKAGIKNIYTFDMQFPDKIRELNISGGLQNIIAKDAVAFTSNYIQPSITKILKEKYLNDITNMADKIYYDGANLYIFSAAADKIRIYTSLNDYLDIPARELFEKYKELLAVKMFFERDDFYIGFDNNAYTYKSTEVFRYPQNTPLTFEDINNENNKFIGVDKNGNFYFWSSLEIDIYDYTANDNIISVIKVFDKNGKLVKLLKNELWTRAAERYNNAQKYIDADGNIFFVFYNSIEKFRFDGTYMYSPVKPSDNISAGVFFAAQQYLFVIDKNSGGAVVLKNENDINYFYMPMTDNNIFITGFDIFENKIICSGYSLGKTGRRNRIFVIVPVDAGRYRLDEIHYPANYTDNLKISKDGKLIACVETDEKKIKRLRIIDIHGINKYIVFSSSASIENIEWLDSKTLAFVEDNKKIIAVDVINNKSRKIFETRDKNIKLFYPLNSNEFYIATATELSDIPKTVKPKTANTANTEQSVILKTGSNTKVDLKFNIDESLIVKKTYDSTNSMIIYKLRFKTEALVAESGELNINIEQFKNFNHSINEFYITDNKLFYSVKSENYDLWYSENLLTGAVERIYGGPFNVKQLREFKGNTAFIMQYGDRSVVSKIQRAQYIDNSSMITGNFSVKGNSPLKYTKSIITSSVSDNIGYISNTGNFSLINPLPGYQKIFVISDNFRINANINRFVDINSSVILNNLPAQQLNFYDYQNACYYEKNKDINGALAIFSKIINSDDYKDTQVSQRINRRLIQLLYKAGRYSDAISFSKNTNMDILNNSYKIMLTNSYLELNDFKNALAVLETIKTFDSDYADFINYYKLIILQRSSNNYGKYLKNTLEKIKDSNKLLYSLLYRDLMKFIGIFD